MTEDGNSAPLIPSCTCIKKPKTKVDMQMEGGVKISLSSYRLTREWSPGREERPSISWGSAPETDGGGI